jgi:WD40 repeat protein
MPDDAIQVELGGDDQPEGSPGGPGGGKAVWLVVGLGLGFALALLFSSSIDRGAIAGADSTTTTAAPALGVGAAIPGFPDGLNVLVSPGEGRALEVLTWPHQGGPFYRSVPLEDMVRTGTAAHFDISGQFLAAMTSTPDGFILRTGRPNTFGVVATRVTGFAWHDSEPADLALSTYNDGELQIWVSEDLGTGELAVSAAGIGDYLVAFGDWGFALGAPEGDDHVLDPNGELVGSITGRIVTSHQSGLLLVTDTGGVSVVSTDGLETLYEVSRDALETLFDFEAAGLDSPALPIIGARFSPNGHRVAMTGTVGLTIARFGDVVEIETFPVRGGSDSLSWSSDGRFVLVSYFGGVAVLDTETGEISSILENETTRAVAATPLGGP